MNCKWCSSELIDKDFCSVCGGAQNDVAPILPETQEDKTHRLSNKNRRFTERETLWDDSLTGILAVGIDPGARHTAICVVDNETVIESSTYKRLDEDSAVDWARKNADYAVSYKEKYPHAFLAVEGINDPKGFNKKGRALLNPRDIIRTGIALGAIVAVIRDIEVIPPDLHGDMHDSHYPLVLKGRRPKDLKGVYEGNTRRHEKSAYDVARKLWLLKNDGKGETKK